MIDLFKYKIKLMNCASNLSRVLTVKHFGGKIFSSWTHLISKTSLRHATRFTCSTAGDISFKMPNCWISYLQKGRFCWMKLYETGF